MRQSRAAMAATRTRGSANRMRGAALRSRCCSRPAAARRTTSRSRCRCSQTATEAERQPATQREHARILASYGGVYENARLQATIEKTVDRLVAASERPDLKYQVTILNSPAINAFALPNGQLYITRGLIALANDKAELASVLAHEMGHVIARHAAIREEQAKQAAIINHVVNDVLSDPQMGALALAKSKLTLASFSRAQEFEADGIGVGISARAGFDPFGASRFLTDMQRNADLKASGSNPDPRSLDFLSSHPATPDRVKNALANARQFSGPGAGERDRDRISRRSRRPDLWRGPERGLRARPALPASQARLHLHGAAGILARQYRAGGARPQGRRRRGAAARRGERAGRAVAARLSEIGLDGECRPQSVEEFTVNGFPAATAAADRRAMVVPAVRRALRQRRLPLHFRGQKQDRSGRPLVPRVGRDLPPHEPEGKRAGPPAASQDRHRRRARHGGKARAPHGDFRSPDRALPRAQRPRLRRQASSRARRSRSWWSNFLSFWNTAQRWIRNPEPPSCRLWIPGSRAAHAPRNDRFAVSSRRLRN